MINNNINDNEARTKLASAHLEKFKKNKETLKHPWHFALITFAIMLVVGLAIRYAVLGIISSANENNEENLRAERIAAEQLIAQQQEDEKQAYLQYEWEKPVSSEPVPEETKADDVAPAIETVPTVAPTTQEAAKPTETVTETQPTQSTQVEPSHQQEVAKTESKSEETKQTAPKPTHSSAPKEFDVRYVDGKKQVYMLGEWMDIRPGGEGIYADYELSGDLIGY